MITAKIIADSQAENGTRVTTFELEYPRFIHSELMTHRMLSRNSASSRAIPLKKNIEMVWNNSAMPVHWGENQKGMQAKKELDPDLQRLAKWLWIGASKVACGFAWAMDKVGLHKQIANRILEPWVHMKVVVSATDWDNFWHLRRHPDAQPEIHELANKMWEVFSKSRPEPLKMNEWHTPYVSHKKLEDDSIEYYIVVNAKEKTLTLEEALQVSASCCAQVSYRLLDNSAEKAKLIYKRLVESKPVHASPFEHQATPFEYNITESGNFRGWKQHRQDIVDNVCKKYIPSAVEVDEDLTPTAEETGTYNEIQK